MCDRCPELEERIAWLESELGLRVDVSALARLADVLRASSAPNRGRHQTAEVVMALYRARGRVMTRPQLLEAAPPRYPADRADKIIDVWICMARHALGKDAIETAWGKGYRLSDVGRSRVAAIIAPVQAEAA